MPPRIAELQALDAETAEAAMAMAWAKSELQAGVQSEVFPNLGRKEGWWERAKEGGWWKGRRFSFFR